jgi:hypothetical protein
MELGAWGMGHGAKGLEALPLQDYFRNATLYMAYLE